MIDLDSIRTAIVSGLREYLGISVIRSNQTGKPPPYPYLSYTITTPVGQNNGSWGKYEDGMDRKPITQTWSITVQSNNSAETVALAIKAHIWFDHISTEYLKEHGIDVQRVGGITNRDNLISIEYEHRNGFDVVLSLFNEVADPNAEIGYVEGVELNNNPALTPKTTEELTQMLNDRLSGR